jgi:uncharacterized coiled-coil protein SlyX
MSAMNSGDEARLAVLEERLAHQEDSMLELSNEVYRQQRQIADLELLARQLKDRLEPLEQAAAPASPGHEIPPHY